MHSRALVIKGRRSVTVRPLANGDTETVSAVLDRSSTTATGFDVSAIAAVDGTRHALVAWVAGDPQPAAIGQLVRVSRTRAEVVLAVVDHYLEAGIDNALVELLAADARAAGLCGPTASAANRTERSGAWRRLVQATRWAAMQA
jgi:hypothetical protein